MKKLLISHIADIDGVTPIVLASLSFHDFDYLLLDVYEVDETINQLIEDNYLEQYNEIFIVDLGISTELAQKINKSNLKEKIHLLDHHISNIWLNEYSFAKVIDTDTSGEKQCGTTLFYQYLQSHYPNEYLDKEITKQIIEYVRLVDTWLWEQKNNKEAKKLSDLFTIIGVDKYIQTLLIKITNELQFTFSEKEEYILEIEEEKIKRYIDKVNKDIWIITIQNQKAGIVFGGNYRSEVAHNIAKKYEEIVDFGVMININSGISYRSIKENDVSTIARFYGGNGHKSASGSPIKEEVKRKLLENIYGSDKIEHRVEKENIYDRIKKGNIWI